MTWRCNRQIIVANALIPIRQCFLLFTAKYALSCFCLRFCHCYDLARHGKITLQPWAGWFHFPKGGETMLDFSFSEFYSFVLALVGVILTYLANRRGDNGHDHHNDEQKK